jgi:hypothetical protein
MCRDNQAFMNELSRGVFSSLGESDIALWRGFGNGLTPILLVAAEETSRGWHNPKKPVIARHY